MTVLTTKERKDYNLKVSPEIWHKVRVHVANEGIKIKPFIENLLQDFFKQAKNQVNQ